MTMPADHAPGGASAPRWLRLGVRGRGFVGVGVASLCLSSLGCDGCDEGAIETAQTAATATAGGLTAEQAQAVVAEVGDTTITLGEFAAALERMNRIDRLRYQTKERRRELLEEMIDLELLAQEAKRRGLDQKAEVQEAVRQVLRDALLAKARENLPVAGAIPAEEVKAYYEANAAEFVEPERRRLTVIAMGDGKKAAEVLAAARKEGASWARLWAQHDMDRDPAVAQQSGDLAGDLGIVEARPDGDYGGPIPAAVQKALFGLERVGDIHPEVIEAKGRHFIVRLGGRSAGHQRTLEEADRAIRVRILKARLAEIEAQLDEDLRKRFPVDIDEEALKRIEVPDVSSARPFWEQTLPPPGTTTDPTSPLPSATTTTTP